MGIFRQWRRPIFRPEGVAVDSSGNVYVTDYDNDRIQKFASDGKFITTWGSSGSGEGQFTKPQGIAVDSSGNVYVDDLICKMLMMVMTVFRSSPVMVNLLQRGDLQAVAKVNLMTRGRCCRFFW